MSKNILVRLHSTSNDGIFDAQFNDEILINPESEIALQSASLSRSHQFIEINGYNDKIEFQISQTNGLRSVFINHGIFNRNTILAELGEVQTKMNKLLRSNETKEAGSQVNIRINQDNKMDFEFGFHSISNFLTVPNPQVEKVNVGKTSNTLRNTGAETNEVHQSYVYGLQPFCKGAGICRARLNKLVTSAGGSGITMGLVEDLTKLRDGSFRVADIKYGIRVPNNTTHVFKNIKDGVETDNAAGIAPLKFLNPTNADNDVCHIELDQGKIKLIIYQDGTTTDITDGDLDLDQTRDYYFFIAIHGSSDNTRINMAGYTVDPFSTPPATFNLDVHGLNAEDNELTAPANPNVVNRPTIYNLKFPTRELADFFGFTSTDQNPNNVTSPIGSFIGQNVVDDIVFTDTYLIELLNLNLESYDSLRNGRKNILSTIPISERIISDTGVIQYEPNTPFYISLNNNQPVSLRNIRARVVTDNYESVIIEGLGTLTVLIKSPKS